MGSFVISRSKNHHYDVVVIGAGMTGLATVYHLIQKRILKIALVSGSPRGAESWRGAGAVSTGQSDNITRLTHARGMQFGEQFWRFGTRAWDALRGFAAEREVPFIVGDRLRFALDLFERQELEQAAGQIATAGESAHFLDSAGFRESQGIEIGERVLGVQSEPDHAGIVDLARLHQALAPPDAVVCYQDSVATVVTEPGSVRLTTEGGQVLSAEIVVLAAHLATGKLIPEIADALVSTAEHWLELVFDPASGLPPPGTMYSARHGYEWGVFAESHSAHVGGGRFLLPDAGIGMKSVSVTPRVESYLLDHFIKTFPGLTNARVTNRSAGLECRPCDELPVIGPMFGQWRILVGTGYMGYGLTQGFLAGQILAELIATGRSAALLPELRPDRLRSLAENP